MNQKGMIEIAALEDGRFITTPKAAEILGVSVPSLMRYHAQGRLRPIVTPYGKLWRKVDLEELMAVRAASKRPVGLAAELGEAAE